MKVHAFRVETNNGEKLDSLMAYIKGLSEFQRIKDTSTTRMRFEASVKTRLGPLLLDFTKFRDAGPGRAPENGPNVDFDLADDEYFGEETAAAYYPSNDCLVVQYNHSGPRSAAIEHYLNIMAYDAKQAGVTAIQTVSLVPIARRDAAERLRRAQTIRRIEFTLYVPGATTVPVRKRKSLGKFLNSPVVASSRRVSITISSGHANSLNVAEAKILIADALGFTNGLDMMKVKIDEETDGPGSVLDMLEARLELDKVVVPSQKKRHDRNHRWSALREAYDEWNRQQLL